MCTPREVRSYETESGRVLFDDWLNSLRDRKAAAKIKARLKRVAEYGNLGDWKQLKGTRIFEFRIGGSSGYPVYFGADEEAIVLLMGGDKDSQKRDVLKARNSGQIMSNVKTPASESFRDYLIKSLQDHNEAAVYLEAILEEDNPEPDLFKSALLDVSEAIGKLQLPHAQYQQHRYELDQILSQPGIQAIYGLANWLNALGLKLTVAVAEQTPEE